MWSKWIENEIFFDNGAANVCLSMTEAQFMLKNGYLNYADFIGKVNVRLADGDVEENDVAL